MHHNPFYVACPVNVNFFKNKQQKEKILYSSISWKYLHVTISIVIVFQHAKAICVIHVVEKLLHFNNSIKLSSKLKNFRLYLIRSVLKQEEEILNSIDIYTKCQALATTYSLLQLYNTQARIDIERTKTVPSA